MSVAKESTSELAEFRTCHISLWTSQSRCYNHSVLATKFWDDRPKSALRKEWTMELPAMGMTLEQDVVFDIASSPNFANDQTAFAGRQSGLYRSTDSGMTWG